MTRGVPMLDPKRDLAGATPEKLARALLRNPLRPRPGVQPVAGNEISEKEISPNHPGNRLPHLDESV